MAGQAVERFADDRKGGFFFSSADSEQLVAPHKELDDSPTPSGQSLMATVLLRLARLHGDSERERLAVGVARLAAGHAQRAPHGFGHMLQAISLHLSPPQEVAVVGPAADPATRTMADAVRDGFHPNLAYAFGDGMASGGLALLEGQGLVDGRPAVYVCERFACQRPVTEPDEVAALVAS